MYLYDELNELLVDTFNIILKSEEISLKKLDKVDLTMNEMHLIEAISKNGQNSTVGSLAAILGITMPSVTVALKKLENKGCVEKNKSSEDGRSIFVTLTEKGKILNELHKKFHTHMISQIIGQLTEDEQNLLHKTVLKLNKYFKKALAVLI